MQSMGEERIKKGLILALFFAVFNLISVVSIADFLRDTTVEEREPLDTIDQVSLILEVYPDSMHTVDLNNHPVFRNSQESFIFSTEQSMPESFDFSNTGLISWKPTRSQVEELISKPMSFSFLAHSRNDRFVTGQIRIISGIEVQEEQVSTEDIVDASVASGAALSLAVDEEYQDTTINEPLRIILPTGSRWDSKKEGEGFDFSIQAKGGSGEYKFEILSPEFLMEMLDPYGNFAWQPEFSFVNADERIKSVMLEVKVFDSGGNEIITNIPLYIEHVNRPPVVNEMPTFYVQYNQNNVYQLKKEGLAFDPDNDSIFFRPILEHLPQGMKVGLNGEISWRPSTSQFNFLRKKPIFLSFIVEDYPEGEQTIGQVKIEVSSVDEPPQIAMIPNKEKFEIRENEELNITFFITDPNGEEDLLSFGFVSENTRIKSSALQKKENWQYEFSWTPGYDFIREAGEKDEFDISFFAIDRESNRVQKNILVTVLDTENLIEKDRILYDQYRTVLERAFDMITQLNEKEKELDKLYRSAKKGKKNRAIGTASLGAFTGLSPIIFMDNPDGQRVATGVGGTATATIGTLEASNVIGEPPSEIMRDLNYVVQKKNDLQVYGNVFASRYALPVSKRDKGFQNDLKTLTIHLNLKDVAKLDLDPSWENKKQGTAKNIKKVFKDFNKDPRFEDQYK